MVKTDLGEKWGTSICTAVAFGTVYTRPITVLPSQIPIKQGSETQIYSIEHILSREDVAITNTLNINLR